MATKFICVLFIFVLLLQDVHVLFTVRKARVELFYSPVDKKSFDLFAELVKVLETDLGQYIDVMMYPIANCELGKSSNIHCKSYSATGQRESLLALEHLCAYDAIVNRPIGGTIKEKNAKLQKSMIKGIKYINCTMNTKFEAIKRIPVCRKKIPYELEVIQKCEKTRTLVPKAFARLNKIDLEHHPFMLINNMWSEYQEKNMYEHLGHLVCKKLFQIPESCVFQIKEDPSDPENLFGVETSSALSTPTRTFILYLLAMTMTILFFR